MVGTTGLEPAASALTVIGFEYFLRVLSKTDERIKKKYDRFRRRYPEIDGKVVDFITHSIEGGTLYFTVRFKDKTDFSLRYACDMFVVGADFCDFKTGDFEMLREYMRPIPR